MNHLDYIYISGISLAILDTDSQSKLLLLLKAFKARGGKVIFDNNYRPQLWTVSEAKQCYQQILERCRQFRINEVTIKRSIKPCVRSLAGKRIEVPAQKVDHVVGTCAAGDSFAAGYLSLRLFENSVTESAQVGYKLAATVIQHFGAIIPISAMPII